jgi:hypothetical protein
LYTGFVAQEVEKAANEIGYNFRGVSKPANDSDFYGIRYTDFIMPLVKAVQELSAKNDSLQQLNAALQSQMNTMQNEIQMLASKEGMSLATTNVTLVSASLEQTSPILIINPQPFIIHFLKYFLQHKSLLQTIQEKC